MNDTAVPEHNEPWFHFKAEFTDFPKSASARLPVMCCQQHFKMVMIYTFDDA